MHCEGRVKGAFAACALLVAAGCGAGGGRGPSTTTGAPAAGFLLRSPAFSAGDLIPRRFTCDGPGTAPPLRWTAPPTGTRSIALSIDDPDAPGRTFTHWMLVGLPPRAAALPAAHGVAG